MKPSPCSPYRRAVILAGLCVSALVAASFAQAQVIPGDTFNFAIEGFNSSGQRGYLVNPLTATFGSTQMFAGAGLANQTVTVSSSQSFNAGFIITTIMISVPMNFIPGGTMIGGMAVTTIYAEIGGFSAGPNTLDFLNPLTGATYSGSMLFGANSTFPFIPAAGLSNGDRSLALSEGLAAGGADLSPFAIRAFSFSVQQAAPAAVPESGETYLLLGCSIAVLLLLRHRMAATLD